MNEGVSASKLKIYQFTLIFSIVFSLLGFSYNVWRMEVSEQNNTIRTASFEILVELSELEQLIYTAHYDRDLVSGSPRKAWVKVGLITNLSVLTSAGVNTSAEALKKTWAENWQVIAKDKDSVVQVVDAIDTVRQQIQQLLNSLE